MRNHTGGVITMDYALLPFQSSNQNHNAKNSNKAELIGTSEYSPFNLYMVMFLEAQRYEIKKNIIFQNNHSTIRMAINGRDSCTLNSSHINIRQFFVKYRVD